METGAGESGKSTLVKQMRIIHKDGFTDDERLVYKKIVYSNVAESVLVLLDAMRKLVIPFQYKESKADERIFYKYLDTIEDKLQINVLVQQAIRRLWADKGVQSCYKRRGEYQLIDSAAYFLDNLKRISEPGYRPTDQDILRSRSATTCIVEVKFIIKGRRLDLIDVGGQRNCRRKWIHFFDDVTGVIFVASLSGYDEVLREDKNTNRLHESLSLFNVICNSKWFTTTSIILFLNKQDVFIQKLKTSPVRRFLPDYTGANSFQEAAEFINLKFQQQNMSRGKKFIYSHYTTAIDTTNILFVFDACLDIIMKDNLKTIGVF